MQLSALSKHTQKKLIWKWSKTFFIILQVWHSCGLELRRLRLLYLYIERTVICDFIQIPNTKLVFWIWLKLSKISNHIWLHQHVLSWKLYWHIKIWHMFRNGRVWGIPHNSRNLHLSYGYKLYSIVILGNFADVAEIRYVDMCTQTCIWRHLFIYWT